MVYIEFNHKKTLKMEVQKKVLQLQTNQKQARYTILL